MPLWCFKRQPFYQAYRCPSPFKPPARGWTASYIEQLLASFRLWLALGAAGRGLIGGAARCHQELPSKLTRFIV